MGMLRTGLAAATAACLLATGPETGTAAEPNSLRRSRAGGATTPNSIEATRNGRLPVPLPLFPPDNWWNLDISAAPLDPNSAAFIGFIGPTRQTHPDFGGNAPSAPEIYGMPYVVVDTGQPLKAVEFEYWDESDGVNQQTGQSFPFYPIPDEAITQPYWIEGGHPGQQCVGGDRHMLIVDRDTRHLFELFALCWDGARWTAGSGAFFDMKTNNRRPEGWTSADAAGLAILPGLVRYDEVFGPDEIDHALRFTVRATNGHVWPASHTAGSNPSALPMGARLRLKASKDISGYLPYIQKIFRAMKRYGLIVADNGSDMYVSGAYDTRWDNGELNPAFHSLTASDFEVVQLGWRPVPAPAPLVAAASPATGTTAGGTAVIVTGSFFQAGAAVDFGGTASPSVTVDRSTRLVAMSPAHAAGAVNVTVTNPDSRTGTLAGGFTYCAGARPAPAVAAPSAVAVNSSGNVASVTPNAGSVYTWSIAGGIITGGQGTSQVTFDAGPPGTLMTLRVNDTFAGCTSAAGQRRVLVHFLDVPPAHGFHTFVNTLARNQVTGGCGGGNYCPDAPVTRAQMAVFLLVAREGAGYAPPACVTPAFADVPCGSPFAAWINELAARGVTGGCGGGNYCPNAPVSRESMSVFLLLTREGPGYVPPACTAATFADVPCSSPFARWVYELVRRNITGGCGGGNYCPAAPVTRGQMAVFLVATFGLTLH
jgi:hypothetical protein